MNNNNDIHETIDQILAELKEEGMTESSIKSGYLSVYKSFLKFLDENAINEVTEEVCLQYIEIKNQIRLPSLLTVTSNDSLNRRIRALVILLRYQKTGSLDLSTRGKKVPFSCPIALASAYEAFATETEKSHLAADTKSTIINDSFCLYLRMGWQIGIYWTCPILICFYQNTKTASSSIEVP